MILWNDEALMRLRRDRVTLESPRRHIDWGKLGLWAAILGINALCWWGIASLIRWLL